MGIVTIKEEEAKFAHQNYYSGPFEVIKMKRSGPLDFPPFSFFYGASDFGSWDGLMSTDGKKIVVTQCTYLDLAKVKNVYEFSVSDIDRFEQGVTKSKLTLKEKIKGLTKGSALRSLMIFPGFVLYLIPAIIAWRMPEKIFEFRPEDEFKNLTKFYALLRK